MTISTARSVLRIAQLTDLHIGTDKSLLQGVDVYQQVLSVLAVLEKKPLDLLVLSGDLALSHGEPEAYQWLADTLANFPIPYVVMAGNHDVVTTMNDYFAIQADIHDQQLYFSRVVNGHSLFFLDTSSYHLPQQQQAWLAATLARMDKSQQALLFMHHPPVLCGCSFMDNRYSLKNIPETWHILRQQAQIQHIFCGHYHTDKTLSYEGKQIYLTPSAMLQIDRDNPDFQIAHTRAGWREIEWDGEQVKTQVIFL
ncbi:metallophosphoesterase [Beggiatoa leptomitoformis]|uniref:Calcineurin-like phosphoesterase domain-containing protein n=1 Tax=Beggiatoa leptomitoformis TaxID=288004 RepID=A0A2N9YI83_9GAMM|nr:metallophosphoesterase [Beggiatoa leptomitoformis]ALG67514.1 hypothetical protein AL038_07120 [Beggiatoa leptomitoformis]AUI70261.1 hypothetical protein BLE401_17190 [Beggiatoa leptomitoformis]